MSGMPQRPTNDDGRVPDHGTGHADAPWRKWFLVPALLCLLLSARIPLDSSSAILAGLDPDQVRIGIGILLCIAILWLSEALPLAATALLVPLLGTLAGVGKLSWCLQPFADPLIFLFFGGFALAAAVSAQGLAEWAGEHLARKARGGFLPACLALFAITAGVSMWMNNTATTALMLPLALGLLAMLPKEQQTAARSSFVLLGVAYSSSIGGLATVIGTAPNAIAASRLGIGFLEWLRYGIPASGLLMVAMVLVLLATLKPGNAPLRVTTTTGFTWNRGRVTTVAVFGAALIAWVLGGVAGFGANGTNYDTMVALAAVLALILGKAATWPQIERGTEWGVLALFGGGLSLSRILDETGTGLFVARCILSLADSWPLFLFLAIALLCVILLGEFASNTATAALLVPVFQSMAPSLGIGENSLVVPVALAATCGFMLPVATPPNAMAFATGEVRHSHMLRAGLMLDLAAFLILAVLAFAFF